MMAYEAKDFSGLLGTDGFSDALLNNHFKLYSGYVANTNKVAELLTTLEPGTPQYAELKRRFGWEFNGMRLHELYFHNISKEKKVLSEDSPLRKKIAEQFGGFQQWENDFKSTGSMRGIGWVVLYHDKEAGRLFNVWIDEHGLNHLSGGQPLLVMDVFEHAFITDYGLNRASYLNAFMNAVDWEAVEKRVI
jgi:Fe-Mn family superoxide dismutase